MCAVFGVTTWGVTNHWTGLDWTCKNIRTLSFRSLAVHMCGGLGEGLHSASTVFIPGFVDCAYWVLTWMVSTLYSTCSVKWPDYASHLMSPLLETASTYSQLLDASLGWGQGLHCIPQVQYRWGNLVISCWPCAYAHFWFINISDVFESPVQWLVTPNSS